MTEFKLPPLETYDWTVPETINSMDKSTDVLNRAPHNIARIKEELLARQEMLDTENARVRLANPDKKQDEIKALQQEDEKCKVARKEVNKADVMFTFWRDAQKSASKFYNT